MYFYKTDEIANGATGHKSVVLKKITSISELFALYKRMVALTETNGDVTVEDVRLTREALLNRINGH